MRICLIGEHASPLATSGGADLSGQGVYVAELARHMAKLGHAVDVFTRRDDEAQPRVLEPAPGLRVVYVDAGPAMPMPEEQLLPVMPQFEEGCMAWMRAHLPHDVIHANSYLSGCVGLRLQRALGLPLVTTFHGLGLAGAERSTESDTPLSGRVAIERQLVAESDRLVAQCPQDEADLLRLYGGDTRRVTMVPGGVDLDEFHPCSRLQARRALGIPDREFMVLQVTRMAPRKGVETAVRAMALLPGWLRARLHVVGGDREVPDETRTPEIARLRAVTRQRGCEHLVVFEGRRPRSELRLWYGAADVFVSVPWYEPFGLAALESMACARPVIGSAIGGVRYSVVHAETGVLVPPKDERALAQALSALHDDRQLAETMGEAGLARARAMFTWQRVARVLEEVYRGVATRPLEAAPDPERAAPEPAPAAKAGAAAHYVASFFYVSGMDVPPQPVPWRGAGTPAIFIDMDGTLVENPPYNVDPARMHFMPTTLEALRVWRDAGYALLVVSNQSGMARGLFGRAELSLLHRSLAVSLADDGIVLMGFYACPHAPGPLRWTPCACRRPAPGLLLTAARTHALALSNSWMVGGILDDVEVGHQAGCRSVLVDGANETDWQLDRLRRPEARCATLLDAAETILRLSGAAPAESAARFARAVAAEAGHAT
jgi:histidinol-phosphate phosphatase family protein